MVGRLNKLGILDSIPFIPDISRIMTRLRFHFPDRNGDLDRMLQELVARVVPAARPKAIYKVSALTGKGQDWVEIEGARFTSYLLRVNLEKVDNIFLFAATCGPEIDSIQVPSVDQIEHYCLEVIKDMALNSAIDYLRNYLVKSFNLDYLWSLSPGEYQAWQVVYQKDLLSLLDGQEESIGIKLREDGALIPRYSRSGVFYYFPTDFENCVLCDQASCMFRRAPYNPELAAKFPERTRRGCAR